MINLSPIRGMHDRLPDECDQFSQIMAVIKEVTESFGYRQVIIPIVESTELFKRSVGISSDIVQKEMYTFNDRNDDSLTLRPEGTAGCYRAYLSEFHRSAPFQRLWYLGPMFRRERPQKGRQREFYQFGLEAFGYDHPSIDVEVIHIANTIFSKLDLKANVICKLNYLGTSETREVYLEELRSYFKPFVDQFDDVHKYRYEQNVLRLLDSKDEFVQSLLSQAPKITNFLTDEDIQTYQLIKSLLEKFKIPYEEDFKLVRGLDYYSGLIYEFQAMDGLGAQNTICAGGRTDNLCNILSGKDGYSLGMAIGIERLLLLTDSQTSKKLDKVFVFTDNESNYDDLYQLQESLQKRKQGVFIHYGVSQLKKQLNRAANMNYQMAVGYIDSRWIVFDLVQNQKFESNSINDVWEHINASRI